MLRLHQVTVTVDHKTVIRDLSLALRPGTTHVLMGPNGSGKTSLAYALMGHPHYRLGDASRITLDRHSLTTASPDKRAQAGLFLAFQTPVAVEGVTVQNFLKVAYENLHCRGCDDHAHCPRLSVSEFRALLAREAASLAIPADFLSRPLSGGFSGGERKRLEMLQLLLLQPKYAVLDETDSGLDIDSLKVVAGGITRAVQEFRAGILLITHYQRILDYLHPNVVSVMVNGRLVQSGSPELVNQLEQTGYKAFLN